MHKFWQLIGMLYSPKFSNSTIAITSGVAFAYGNSMLNVVGLSSYSGPTGTGIVLAWNKQAGNTHYEKQSKEDIFVSPATATAHWDVIGGKAGIYYANGTNTGFIPLEVSVLSVSEPATAGFNVWPNPTTGELRVMSYELRVGEIEVFDVYGRKVGAKFLSNLLERWTRSGRGGFRYFSPAGGGLFSKSGEWGKEGGEIVGTVYFLCSLLSLC